MIDVIDVSPGSGINYLFKSYYNFKSNEVYMTFTLDFKQKKYYLDFMTVR